MRLDLHNHTWYSPDGDLLPRALLETAARRGIDCLGVTDHETLRGGLECAALAEADVSLPRVIPGQEITTAVGEVIGFFLAELVPPGLSLDETVARIHAQGGVAYLPHPFDRYRRSTIRPEWREHAAALCDVVEVGNGRTMRPSFDRDALALAARLGRSLGAGSDAHFAAEVGRVFLEVPAEVGRAFLDASRAPGRDELLAVLRVARPGSEASWTGFAVRWSSLLRSAAQKRVRRGVDAGRTG
jgi:predicted metal-dependent phosphoesterase TrpH